LGLLEPINSAPTGQTFHCYLYPERDMPADAVEVHGLTAQFLGDKPLFAAVGDELLSVRRRCAARRTQRRL
jgi:DNA polymerase-3 subunit epsilon